MTCILLEDGWVCARKFWEKICWGWSENFDFKVEWVLCYEVMNFFRGGVRILVEMKNCMITVKKKNHLICYSNMLKRGQYALRS